MIRGKTPLYSTISIMWLMLGACAGVSAQDSGSKDDSRISSSPAADPTSTETRVDMDIKIEVLVSLVAYSDTYYRDHYEGGGYEFYKISGFRIVEPSEYAGKALNIRHHDSPGLDSFWRDVGVVVRLSIAEATLNFVAGERHFDRAYVGAQSVEILEIRE